MKRREFLIPKERAYNMDADPDNLWELTYTGPQQSIEDRMERFKRLVSEKYDMGYSGIESNYRAKMFRNVYDEVPRQKYSIGKYEAVPARSGEFTVNIDGRRIHYNTNGYEIRKGDELVDDLPLVTFLNVDRQGQHYMFGTDIDIQANGDRWLVSRMAKRRAKNRLSKTRPADPIAAFADLIAHADAGGKTIVFDDPAKSMLAFSDSSYLWGGRTRRKLPAQDMDFEVGGGWQRMLKEQFGFKQVDGKWVRPPAHERTRFHSVNEALLFFTTET
jgi:hypothetical protein